MSIGSLDWYAMVAATIDALYREELLRPSDIVGAATWLYHAREEGKDVEWIRAEIRKSDEWHAIHDKKPLPTPPTRDYVCGIVTHFQGLYYNTREFGRFPADFLALLQDDDFDAALETHREAGDRHVTMDLTSAYREPGVVYPERLRNGHDWSNDLPGIKRQIRRAIVAGFCVDFALGGDGRSVNANPQHGQYNDPVGDTYGHEWLMQNFPRIGKAMRGDADSECLDGEDLTKWIVFRPGYDGVFYGWGGDSDGVDRQPQRVIDFGKRFRSVLPNGYLSIEHDTGHFPIGKSDDYVSRMQDYDVIMSEFDNWPRTGDPTWQVAARSLGPAYRRPADEPASDDTNPPFDLAPGTPRGPYFACAFEFAKFPESRGRISANDVDTARNYYRALGYPYTG